MLIAVLLYDGFTTLDAIGPYEVLTQLPDAETAFVAERRGPVPDHVGSARLVASAALDEVPAPDIIMVPGGPVASTQLAVGPMHEWVRAADRTSTWTTSVCTGSLVLAAAGLLDGRRATSHWLALDLLRGLGATPTAERVVVDGKYVTAAGVSAGIDMALTLVGRVAGDHVAQAAQLGLEYHPEPPYRAGSPDTAPAEIVADMRANAGTLLGC